MPTLVQQLKSAPRRPLIALALLSVVAVGGALSWSVASIAQDGQAKADAKKADDAGKAGAQRPALTVALTAPQPAQWPQVIAANGNVVAWQEAVIGAEISGYRLTEVLANVGDVVKKGQLLARVSADTVQAELAQSKAAAVEAEATLAEARANAERARQIQASGALSAQQISQYLTAEQTALARLNAARAKVQAEELRLSQTRVVAPDDGVISARTATVGSLAQPGQELFRLIRGGRLEWRAEVTADDLARVKPGMTAQLSLPGASAASSSPVSGKVRIVAPTIDPQTRNALVYVDLPAGSGARAGMFARGELQVGQSAALTLPQSAVLMRDGFAFVYRVGADSRVAEVKVDTGRRLGDRVEILRGIAPGTQVVATGTGFLNDGDLVRVVQAPAATAARQ
ncbi:MAG: efflux RND transporter periplasmic adaptor subunit [Burkholderiaceae bacterium]|nr:efflux RND transporter periplasmic adaptor subunit [Burkholderiaceae bacterium]